MPAEERRHGTQQVCHNRPIDSFAIAIYYWRFIDVHWRAGYAELRNRESPFDGIANDDARGLVCRRLGEHVNLTTPHR